MEIAVDTSALGRKGNSGNGEVFSELAGLQSDVVWGEDK